MSAEFFYRTYSKFSKKNNSFRLRVTPFGIAATVVCIVSGLSGLNIFSSGLYRVFSLSFSLLLVSYLSIPKKMPDIKIRAFFDKQYSAGERSNFGVRIYNDSISDIYDIELIPSVRNIIPSREDFLNIPEPGEKNRNIWDRNIFYFRWLWHQFKNHKAEFEPLNIRKIGKDSFNAAEHFFSPLRRGRVKFEGFYFLQKSAFGLFTSSKFIKCEEDIIILPKKAPPDRMLENRIRMVNDRMTRSAGRISVKHKAGDFVGLRDYVPGDPYKNIHWKTWAKTGKPAVIEKGVERIKEFTVVLINTYNDPEAYSLLPFEDLLSVLYRTFLHLESTQHETSFFYFDDKAKPCSLKADDDKGNYSRLYTLLTEIRYVKKDENELLNDLEDIFRLKPALMVFSTGNSEELKNIPGAERALFVGPEPVNNDITEINHT